MCVRRVHFCLFGRFWYLMLKLFRQCDNVCFFILLFQYIQVVKGIYRTAYWCKIQFPPLYFKLYELYMFFIMFVIPVMVMAICYTMISIEIWHIVSNRAMMRSGRWVLLTFLLKCMCQNQESERSCIWVLECRSLLFLWFFFLLVFGTVPTVWYFLFFILLLWSR